MQLVRTSKPSALRLRYKSICSSVLCEDYQNTSSLAQLFVYKWRERERVVEERIRNGQISPLKFNDLSCFPAGTLRSQSKAT